MAGSTENARGECLLVRRMNQLVPIAADRAPAIIADDGARASYRFFEFFTANIRNPHTRRAYALAAAYPLYCIY